MGRPLNKKYFGNRNIGTTGTTADDKIGGEGIYAIATATVGSIVINATYPQPVLTIPAPTFPGGVQATATVTWEVDTITVTNGLDGNGYVTTTGGATTLNSLAGVTANITAVGSGQGEVQTIVPVNRGTFTTVPTTDVTYQILGGDGGNQAEVRYRIRALDLTEGGSGYGPTAPTLSWTVGSSNGTMPEAPIASLTTDSGFVGSATNQENAIIIHANTSSGGTTALVGDIIKQVSTRRYKVKTTDGIKICKLGTTANPAPFGAYVIATDEGGATYYVTKLTAHKAVLVNKTGSPQFADGTAVNWTFGSAVEDYSVTIENA